MELKTYFAQDRAGNLIPNATVTIYLTGTNTLATGLKAVNDAALSNPFTATADGKIQFKAADGIYDMQVSYGTQTGPRITIQCLDQAGQVAAAQQAANDAEAARDQTQQIIDDAGEQSTLVVLAQPTGAGKVGTSLNITVSDWLRSTRITPNMFYKPTDEDWLPAFRAAAEESRRLGLPATLIPAVEYTFRSKVDLAMFPNGIVSDASRNNKVVLKAVANINNDEVFVSMKNVDRRKTGGFIILANNLYDVAFDTTWDLTGGPSLMMTWEKIQIEGWRKIGWRANNNNDVWNKNITVLGPGADATPDCVSYYNHSAGGPISFEGCSFAGGRIKVTAQHISASYCVFRGVEIKDGGSGWNTFAGIGCHFFKDTYYNACFRFAGNVQGFSVIGGLVEPTDGGVVLLGASAGGQGYLNCGQLEFINTRISSYSSSSPAVLASGTMLGAYGKKRICIRGGIAEIASYDPSSMGWVDELLCEQVLLNQQSTTVTTRLFTTTGLNHRESAVIRSMHRAKFDSTGCLVTGMCATLSSTGRNFGNIDFLSGDKTQVSAGRIRVAYSDGGGYAEYTYQRTGANVVTLTPVNSAFSSSDRTLNVYTSGSTLVYISNGRPAGSAGDNWTILVEYSGYLDYTP